jgi:peptidyl-prolyl cis-trans isomerase D
LDAIKRPAAPDYAKLKPKLEEEARKNKAAKRFAEAAELFSATVHDEPDSLQAAVDVLRREPFDLKLEPQKAGWFTAAGGDHPLLNNEKFLRSVFTEDVLKKKFNSEAVEIAPGMLVSARVLEYEPVQPRAFAEVQAQIVQKLTSEKAAELARQDGEAKLARLRKGEAVDAAWSPGLLVSRERPQGLSPEAAQEVFRADASKLPAYVGVGSLDGRYLLLRVSKVVSDETVNAEARKALGRQLDQAVGRQEFEARLASLKQKADVRINRKAIEKGG